MGDEAKKGGGEGEERSVAIRTDSDKRTRGERTILHGRREVSRLGDEGSWKRDNGRDQRDGR